MIDRERLEQAIGSVEHPAIALSLVELGMVRDVTVKDDDVVDFTLVIPFAGVPEMIRQAMIGGVRNAIEAAGGRPGEVTVVLMTEEERQRFLALEHANWRGGPPA